MREAQQRSPVRGHSKCFGPSCADACSALPQASRYGTLKLDPQTMARRINWLNSIRDWQAEFVGTLTAREFVACVTDDLLGRGVFAFTPSGEVMRLPKVRILGAF